MSDVYTPNDEHIRNAYLYVYWEPGEDPQILVERQHAWERWLEQHDMEIREETRSEAYTEGYDEGYIAGQQDLWNRVEEEYL